MCVINQPDVSSGNVSAKNVWIESSATITMGSGTLNVSGNWTNNGTFTASTGTVNFNGSSAQTIGGTAGTTFYNLTVNNPSTGITLSAPVATTNALTMTQGNITAASNLLTIGTSSSPGSINWTAGTIVGPLKRWFANAANSSLASGIFPIGNSSYNRYARISFTQAPSAAGYIIAEYKAGAPMLNGSAMLTGLPADINGEYITNYEEEGYYDITPYSAGGVAYAALNNVEYTLVLRGNQLGTVTETSTLRIIKSSNHTKWNDNPSGNGTHEAPAGTTADFTIGAAQMVGFSWFAVGSGSSNALPITLSSFSVDCLSEEQVQIDWVTESETNSNHLQVQRSVDGRRWDVIAIVTAAGNSTSPVHYSTRCGRTGDDINYYRLYQVDHNADSEHFKIASGQCENKYTRNQLKVYPNPANGEFNIELALKAGTEAEVMINDASGRLIYSRHVSLDEGKSTIRIQELAGLPGVYFVQVKADLFISETVMVTVY